MLHISPRTPSQATPTNRRELRRELRQASPKKRAAVGARLVTGVLAYLPSPAEAAAIVETHPRLLHSALGQPPKVLTDVELIRLLERLGIERVLAALDCITAPYAVAAE